MPSPDFLKKLQDSLEKGEKTEVSDYLNEIAKLASNITSTEAAEKIDKRLSTVGTKEKMNDEERKEVEEKLSTVEAEQKENDLKLKLLADIQQKEYEIKAIELEKVIAEKDFQLKITNLQLEKMIIMNEYEKKYGTI